MEVTLAASAQFNITMWTEISGDKDSRVGKVLRKQPGRRVRGKESRVTGRAVAKVKLQSEGEMSPADKPQRL